MSRYTRRGFLINRELDLDNVVATTAPLPAESRAQIERLASLAEDVVGRCRAAGASEVEVGANVDSGLSVNVRLGEVETIEHTRDRSFGVTVYFGKRKGSASTADLQPDSITKTIEQALSLIHI